MLWIKFATSLIVGILLMVARQRVAQSIVAQQNWAFGLGLGERHVKRGAWIALGAGLFLVLFAILNAVQLVKAMR